jgi:hypothetical protein
MLPPPGGLDGTSLELLTGIGSNDDRGTVRPGRLALAG